MVIKLRRTSASRCWKIRELAAGSAISPGPADMMPGGGRPCLLLRALVVDRDFLIAKKAEKKLDPSNFREANSAKEIYPERKLNKSK